MRNFFCSILISAFLCLNANATLNGPSGIPSTQKGVANGVATLDGTGKVPASQIPAGGGGSTAWGSITGTLSNQTDLNTALGLKANTSALAAVATSGSYLDLINKPSIPTLVSQLTNDSLFVNAAGASAAAPVQSVAGRTGTVTLTSSDVGLANVNNTSDANKPISTATQTALNAKEPTITVGSNLQYWRGDKTFQTLDTSAVPENGNLYYTAARFNSAFASKDTGGLAEGSNLYFTNARAIAAPLTGYTSGAGVISSSDSVLAAIQKLSGNIAALPTPVTAVTGTLPIVSSGGLTPAISINNFAGDTYTTAGTAGAVPAPSATYSTLGYFLGAPGWLQPDLSKPRYSDFTLLNQTASASAANTKFQDAAYYTDGAGNNYVLASGNAAATMVIYNVNNVNKPVRLSTTAGLGSFKVQVVYPYAYIPTSGGSTFSIYNISNPTLPVLTGSLAISGGPGSLYNCAIIGNYAYLATQSKGLTVVDITTPSTPVQIYQEGGTLNKSFGVLQYDATHIYTTNYQTTFPATVRYLKYWDVSTPSAPTLLTTYTIPGGPTPTSTKPNMMTISGNYMYLTDTNQQIVNIIDITTPASPNYLTYFTPTFTMLSGFTAQVVGNYAYIASGSSATLGGAIDLFNISNKSAPYKVATTYSNQANSPFGNVTLGPSGYLFVGDYGNVGAGTTSFLDVFTTPNLAPVQGTVVADTVTTVNALTGKSVKVTSFGAAGFVKNDGSGNLFSVSAIGSSPRNTFAVSANTTIPTIAVDYIYNVNTTAGSVSMVLPDAVASAGYCVAIKNVGSPQNTITTTAFSGQTIDASASDLITDANESHTYCPNSGNWFNY